MNKLVKRLFSYRNHLESVKSGVIGYNIDSVTQEWIDRDINVNAHIYNPFPEVIVRGVRNEIFNVSGKRFLDCVGGFATLNFGHCHPKIADAMKNQLDVLTHTGRYLLNDKMVPCQELISETFGYEKSIMMNSGAEACETAVKMAKRWGCIVKGIPMNEARVVFPTKNFWGKTIAAAAITDDPLRSEGFGPYGLGLDLVDYNDLEALETYFKENPNCSGYLFEPIQGRAGIIIPDDGYLKGVRHLCTKYNVLMMADEVQCGLGRTGYLKAVDYESVRPDVLVMAKAISGGYYPVSIVLADDHIMKVWGAGMHGSTFSSTPLGCTVVMASLQVLREENQVQNSRENGEYLLNGIKSMGISYIKEVRGRGMFIAMDPDPNSSITGEMLSYACLKEGMITLATSRALRLSPPLTFEKKDCDEALEKLQKALKQF